MMELKQRQNEEKSKISHLVRSGVQPRLSNYGCKVNGLVEKCLFYSTIQNQLHRTSRSKYMKSSLKKFENDDRIEDVYPTYLENHFVRVDIFFPCAKNLVIF